jgi:hypothetical protein
MVVVHLGVLSRQENRCVLTYLWYMCYSKDLISLLGVGTVLRNLTAYQMIRLRWGASQVPGTAQNRPSPYPICGVMSSLGASNLPISFVFYPDYDPPWVYNRGGRIGGTPVLVNIVLSALFWISSLSPPFLLFGCGQELWQASGSERSFNSVRSLIYDAPPLIKIINSSNIFN